MNKYIEILTFFILTVITLFFIVGGSLLYLETQKEKTNKQVSVDFNADSIQKAEDMILTYIYYCKYLEEYHNSENEFAKNASLSMLVNLARDYNKHSDEYYDEFLKPNGYPKVLDYKTDIQYN